MIQNYLTNDVPIGVIQSYAGLSPPDGWLFCNGDTISRTSFSGLFEIIGESYGPGDVITTFNLPDLRGRVIVGKDDMGGFPANRVTDGDILGNSGGA